MLTGIIFGYKTKDGHKKQIKKWIENCNPKPKLYYAKINNDTYALDIVEIP